MNEDKREVQRAWAERNRLTAEQCRDILERDEAIRQNEIALGIRRPPQNINSRPWNPSYQPAKGKHSVWGVPVEKRKTRDLPVGEQLPSPESKQSADWRARQEENAQLEETFMEGLE